MGGQFLVCTGIHADGLPHQFHIHTDTSVVDLLVEMVLVPDILRHREPGQLLLDGHLRFHIPEVVDFEPRPLLRGILRVGVPGGLENGMFQIGKVLVQGLVASFGTAVIAANAMANNVVMIPHVSGNAIGLAMVTVVGQCVGAGEFGQARRYIFRLTALVYGTMGTLEVFLGLSAGFWVGLFHLPAETTSITLELIRSFVVAAILFWPASFALPNGLRAAGDIRYTMFASIFATVICRVALSVLFGLWLDMGVTGIAYAMVGDWLIKAILIVVRYQSRKWTEFKVI